MISTHAPRRIFIVYQHGLFAQGLQSLLGKRRRTVQILGMESDPAKALKAVRLLKPEVIIAEEGSAGKGRRMCVGTFLERATAGRVVTLSLNHHFATVYHKDRVTTLDSADLAKVIQGDSEREQVAGPDRLKAVPQPALKWRSPNVQSQRRKSK